MKKEMKGYMKNLRYLYIMVVIAFGIITIVGSGGGGGGGGGSETQPSPGTTQDVGIITGKVKDDDGNSIGGVKVTAEGRTTSSNEQGFFIMDNVLPTNRMLVNFTKEGYVVASEITKIQAGISAYLEPVMAQYEHTETISGDLGGTVSTTDGCKVTIGPNALVDSSGSPYNGQATIALTTFDPTTESGLNAFPGEFEGVTIGGDTVPFESYGYADITITGIDGSPLQLASGETATVEIPIASSLSSSAPDSIPLWYYDTTDGKWHEEGTSTRVGTTNIYRGTVTHFSPWNCDKRPEDRVEAWVSGRVIDSSGNPIQGAVVRILAANGGVWSAGEPSTAQDGTFIILLPGNRAATIQVSQGGVSTNQQFITTPPEGETLNVGDIHLGGAPKVRVILTWRVDPNDLDAHLTIPTSGGYEHIYFPFVDQLVEGARLDTDDTNSYGPEIITIYDLNDGIYRYSVHHYLGSGSCPDSEAVVNLDVDGLGLYQFTPPAEGAEGQGDVWRVCDIVVSGRKVQSVSPINDYLKGIRADDLTAFSP